MITWTGNWVTFLDTILQAIVLSASGTDLRLPTRIRKLVVHPRELQNLLTDGKKSHSIPVYIDSFLSTTTAGSAVQISGLHLTAIPRRPSPVAPILEEYKFVPFFTAEKNQALLFPRNLLDVAFENRKSFRSVKVLHVWNGNDRDLTLDMYTHINSHLLVEVDFHVVNNADDTKEEKNFSNFKVSSWNPMHHSPPPPDVVDVDIAIAQDVMKLGNELIPSLISCLASSNGFVLLREEMSSGYEINANGKDVYLEMTEEKLSKHNMLLIGAEIREAEECIWLLCRTLRSLEDTTTDILEIRNKEYGWVKELKELLGNASEVPVWLLSRQTNNGIVGMVNCLRQEPGGDRIRCIFDTDGRDDAISGVDFTKAMQKDLLINVRRDGKWGSFRHSPLDIQNEVEITRGYVDSLTRGDLASLRWIAEPDLKMMDECRVGMAALNFRDVMLASGKLPPDAIPGDLSSYKTLIGMEFSGWDANGNRVMGLLAAQGLATNISAESNFTWNVPDNWSLEDACTVPVVYSTAYYSLIVRGNLRRGQSVLVHSGCGGVGQAAIAITLSMGCTVFTTVSTRQKRQYLLERYPSLSDDCFSTSRDLSFETDIMRRTKGRGVDLVLNSLSGDKLLASARCVAKHGRFLEIGKYDLANDSKLGMSLFLRNISFHGILLDSLFEHGNYEWKQVYELVKSGIREGIVRPLNATIFERSEVESAFRFMAQGKHFGKVLIKVSETRHEKIKIQGVCRATCKPDRVYLITGGLGGFGLELCNWLVGRGARNLVLTSRSGVSGAYQQKYITSWKEVGIKVIVSKCDVGTIVGTEELLRMCCAIAPVAGVFHLAMVLRDSLLENQTPETFNEVCAPKAEAAENLDQVTRVTCPRLEWFVGFSSVVSGRGNAGQSNYGYANSSLERICERRFEEGLPGLAIQWGAIGDVGIVMDTLGDRGVGGTLPQKIPSCFKALDEILCQKRSAVVSSFVPAPKKSKNAKNQKDGNSIVSAVANILGIKDSYSVDKTCTLGSLGLDSLMGVEVQQTLERMYGVSLTGKEVRLLTMAKIEEMGTEIKGKESLEDEAKLIRKLDTVADRANVHNPGAHGDHTQESAQHSSSVCVMRAADGI